MEFDWDNDKNQKNRRKHGFDFHDAQEIFADYYLEKLDKRYDYGEDRWIALGRVHGVICVLVYTERNAKLRPISLRKATATEQVAYEKACYERLEKN